MVRTKYFAYAPALHAHLMPGLWRNRSLVSVTSESTSLYIHEEYSGFEKEMDFSAESRLKLKVIRNKYLRTAPSIIIS